MKTIDLSKKIGTTLDNLQEIIEYYYDEIERRDVAFTGYNTELKEAMRLALRMVNFRKSGQVNMELEIIFE